MNKSGSTGSQLIEEIEKLNNKVKELTRSSDKYKLTERILLEKEKSYRNIFNEISDAIYILNKEGKFVDVNEGAVKMYGYTRAEFIGKTPEFLSAPGKNDIIATMTFIKEAFEGKTQIFEWWGKRKNGEIFPKEVLLNKGSFSGEEVVISIGRDITERKKNEALQATLYNIAQETTSTKDLNEFYSAIHTIIKGMMYADNFYIAVYDEKSGLISFPYFKDEIDDTPAPKKPSRGLTEYIMKTGEPLLAPPDVVEKLISEDKIDDIGAPSIDWLGVPLITANKTFGVLVVQSYTEKIRYTKENKELLTFVSQHVATALERKQAAIEIKSYSSKLEELNKNKDKFFSIISHDLRSPFHPLLGLAELLSNETDTLTKEEIKDYTTEIYELLKNQYQLLEELLEWAKIQSNTVSFNFTKLSLKNILDDVIAILSENASKKEITYNLQIDENISVYADKNFLRSILQNLISNAIKFSFDKGIIFISSQAKENFLEISIKDEGIGLGEEELNNLFAIYADHSKPGTHNEKGSGLGLILCKEMVERHGGKILVKSEKDKGCNFTFTLPLAR